MVVLVDYLLSVKKHNGFPPVEFCHFLKQVFSNAFTEPVLRFLKSQKLQAARHLSCGLPAFLAAKDKSLVVKQWISPARNMV